CFAIPLLSCKWQCFSGCRHVHRFEMLRNRMFYIGTALKGLNKDIKNEKIRQVEDEFRILRSIISAPPEYPHMLLYATVGM
ncbi:MAG: hypothetical protein RDU47_05145, partial [Spirochaetia bacterium]|nr:hypothetical protein [Spirochaetia bacterium]